MTEQNRRIKEVRAPGELDWGDAAAPALERFSYVITPRATHAGGGWRLQLLEDGKEVGGGVYPVNEDASSDDAHQEAMDDGEAWLMSRGEVSERPGAIPAEAEVQADEAKLYRDLTGDAMQLGFDGIPSALEALRKAGAPASADNPSTAGAAKGGVVEGLARELVAGYPDLLPSLYCDGKPVGKMLLAAVKSGSDIKSTDTQAIGMVVKATFGSHKILVANKPLDNVEIGTAVYLAAPVAQSTAGAAEPERLSITESKEYLIKFMEQHFTDKTFHRYIRGGLDRATLAGDFAWELARALRMILAAPALNPSDAQAVRPPVKIDGLGRVTNEDDGYLTLQFRDEDSAQAFMQNYHPSVEVDDMPEMRDPAAQAAPNAQTPIAYVNGNELANMLDDRTATIQTNPSGYRKTPLYAADPAPQALADVRDQALSALTMAEAALADIGDADREPGDDVAWCEDRAAKALPVVRETITTLRATNGAVSDSLGQEGETK